MPEHEAIVQSATIETLEFILALCDSMVREVERRMTRYTPDRIAPDQSREYVKGRAYNEGQLDMAAGRKSKTNGRIFRKGRRAMKRRNGEVKPIC